MLRTKAAIEAGSMAANPLSWTISKVIEHGIDILKGESVTFRDLYPQGARLDRTKPIPLGFMINPPEAPPIKLPNTATPPIKLPNTATPPIVAGEGAQTLDSWMWTEQLMQTRRQVAQAEAQAAPLIAKESARAAVELPPITVTSTALWPALLIAGLVYMVIA